MRGWEEFQLVRPMSPLNIVRMNPMGGRESKNRNEDSWDKEVMVQSKRLSENWIQSHQVTPAHQNSLSVLESQE